MARAWWEDFFDERYLELWGQMISPEQDQKHVEALWALLDLRRGAKVLDAPCGFGRLSKPLAELGASVLGVDQAAPLIALAEQRRAQNPAEQLRYLRQDLRQPLAEGGFDAALNVFSSIGYGSEDDDLAIFATLRRALRPGAKAFFDTQHRDSVVTMLARGGPPGQRFPDGTVAVETPRWDPVSGRMDNTWHLSGPRGTHSRSASLRIYTITELLRLLERAGFALRSVHAGCSTDPFRPEGPSMGGRVGLLVEAVATGAASP